MGMTITPLCGVYPDFRATLSPNPSHFRATEILSDNPSHFRATLPISSRNAHGELRVSLLASALKPSDVAVRFGLEAPRVELATQAGGVRTAQISSLITHQCVQAVGSAAAGRLRLHAADDSETVL